MGIAFPKRLVGEFELSEPNFRELLCDLRELSSLRKPPTIFPRVGMVAMVFTARYDYRGAFWKAFQKNIGCDDIDKGDWGEFFRRNLRALGLFSPPEHWMVNVFPVLYHAIIPESSKGDFGVMVRSLTDSLDLRDLNDVELLEAVKSYDLPLSLRLFVASKDSAEVACDLIRRVSEDFRQLSPSEYAQVDVSSIRGALLASVCNASSVAQKRFELKTRLLVWRWDFGSGEIGVRLTGRLTFDDLPLWLRLGERKYEIDCFRDSDGRWAVSPRIIPVPPSLAGSSGVMEFASGQEEAVRLASFDALPLFFRSNGNYGTFASISYLESGIYGIAADRQIVLRSDDQPISPLELLPSPNVYGANAAALYELSEGDRVEIGERQISVHGRMRPSATIARTTSWLVRSEGFNAVPGYDECPRIRFESPLPSSTYRIKDLPSNRTVAEAAFEARYSARLELPVGGIYRASILSDGRASGASAVEFAVLPIRLELAGDDSEFVVRVAGAGSLSLKDGHVDLTNEPVAVPLDDLQGEPLQYSYLGRHYWLQYVGSRPVVWRLDGERFSRNRLLCDAGSINRLKIIEFRGTPGATVSLASSQERSYEGTIGPDGRLSVPLSCLLVGQIDERVTVTFKTSDARVACLDIVGVPIAHYVDIGLQEGSHDYLAIGGTVALDRAAETVHLALRPYRQPWCGSENIACDGFARSWEVYAQCAPAEHELRLVAEVDGREVQVFDRDGPWIKIVGQQYPNRDELGRALFEALSLGSDNDDDLDDVAYSNVRRRLNGALAKLRKSPLSRSLTIRRCIEMLKSRDAGTYRAAIGRIFGSLGLAATASDMSAMTDLLGTQNAELTKFAALTGLPIASGDSRLWPSDDSLAGRRVGDPIRSDALTFFLHVAQVMDPDGQASDFIDKLADDPTEDELLRSYAKLLRITLTTEVPEELQHLNDEFDLQETRRARGEAARLLEHSGFSLDVVLQLPSTGSLFARCTSTIWLFAFASRIVVRRAETTGIPLGAIILSKWLYKKSLGPLARCALNGAEEECARHVPDSEVLPC